MIATAWLCTVLTLLFATKLVYTAPRGSYDGYPLEDMDTNMLQNDYFISKRNKPSLSIVNPLDVLRQRLLLEIARRQMKENTRQVELNRAILKNVGKRMLSKLPNPLAATLFDIYETQQHQQMPQEPMQQLLYDLELIPTTLIFDYLQQQQHQRSPWLPNESTAIQIDNINNMNDAIEDDADADDDDDDNNDVGNDVPNVNIAGNGILVNNEKHSMKHSQQSNNEQASSFTNEHETTLKKPINSINANKVATLLNHHKNDLNDVNDAHENINFHNINNNINHNNDANNNQGAADYQVQRYLYHLHKNHLTRK